MLTVRKPCEGFCSDDADADADADAGADADDAASGVFSFRVTA